MAVRKTRIIISSIVLVLIITAAVNAKTGFINQLFLNTGIVAKKGDLNQKADKNRPMVLTEGTENENSTVSIVQSDKENAAELQYEDIKEMVYEAVELAGGLEGLVKNNSVVVIKPNLVEKEDYTYPNWGGGEPLAAEVNGVTADYRVTQAVVELVRELNPDGKIYIMEGSAVPTKEVMQRLNYTHEFIEGVDEFIAIEEDSGEWQDFKSPNLVRVDLPEGILHKEYYYNKKYYEADVLIDIPTMKTHWSASVTGAIKNVGVGATPASIYGKTETVLNRNRMVEHDSPNKDLHKWIHDYYLGRPVDFVVMDGLQGIQNGPVPCHAHYGTNDITKEQMNMRLILAGADAVSADTIESLVMAWDPEGVGYLEYLAKSGAGILDTRQITVIGEQVTDVRKVFGGRIPVAGGKKLKDFTAPMLNVEMTKDNDIYTFKIAAEDAAKIELYLDGLFEKAYIPDEGELEIKLKKVEDKKHTATIIAYDKYLNSTDMEFTIPN